MSWAGRGASRNGGGIRSLTGAGPGCRSWSTASPVTAGRPESAQLLTLESGRWWLEATYD